MSHFVYRHGLRAGFARTIYAQTSRSALTREDVAGRRTRATVCLTHALEYLELTRPLAAELTPRQVAVDDGVSLLRWCHSQVFLERKGIVPAGLPDTLKPR